MRGIGSTGSMMDMGSKRGQRAAVIEASIDRGVGTVLGCTDFIQEMCMLGSGLTGRAMVVECILVLMEVNMLGSLSGA